MPIQIVVGRLLRPPTQKPYFVIPAKAGTQALECPGKSNLGPRFRGDDRPILLQAIPGWSAHHESARTTGDRKNVSLSAMARIETPPARVGNVAIGLS